MDYPPSGPRNGDYSYRQNVDKYRRVIPPDHAGPDLQVNYDETWLRLGMRVKVTRRLLPHDRVGIGRVGQFFVNFGGDAILDTGSIRFIFNSCIIQRPVRIKNESAQFLRITCDFRQEIRSLNTTLSPLGSYPHA